MNGFSDHKAVEAYLKQGRHLTRTGADEKIKITLGTLRTKVLIQESKLYTRMTYNLNPVWVILHVQGHV